MANQAYRFRTRMMQEYSPLAPERAELDALADPAVIEFGTGWCGYCRTAEPLVAGALAHYPQVRHYRIEDGKGRRLGRSYGIKLWPTLVFLRGGREVARVIRPQSLGPLREALDAIVRGEAA